MPESEAQRRLAGMALSMQRGETAFSKSKEAAKMARSMSRAELREMASKPVKK